MQEMTSILDVYTLEPPSLQNTIAVFEGEWASILPPLHGESPKAGVADLFNDQRIRMLNDFISVQGKSILELGPLEAGHTYMLQHMGAAEILGVESNSRAFLKCLIVKEMYNLNKARFLYGDVLAYLKQTDRKFDICLASGILYHSPSPVELIEQCAKVSSKLFIWTHYFNKETNHNYPALQNRFSGSEVANFNGFKYTMHRFEYLSSLESKVYLGGPKPYSMWLEKEAIYTLLQMCGFQNIHTFFEDPSHPHGSNICLIAEK